MTSEVKKFNKRKRSCGCPMGLNNANPTTSSLLSEKNNVRQVMLKSRFAETILKAKEKMIELNGGNNVEKEILEKRKAYAEAKARDARTEMMLIQKQRKVARISLENMPKTVEWNDAVQIQKEFEKLIGCGGNSKKTTCAVN